MKEKESTSLIPIDNDSAELSICIEDDNVDTSANTIMNLDMDIEEPLNQGFLANNDKNEENLSSNALKHSYIDSMRKDFKSMYVLNFVQNENIFEYFKSLLEMNFTEEFSNNVTSEAKRNNKTKCKYLHMIIQNPSNKNESYELGLKVIDIVPTNTQINA